MFEAGGVTLLMKTLLDHGFLHGNCMTVTGRTIAQNLKSVKWNPDQEVIRPANKPITKTGGVVGLKGNLAPEGAIVKVAGMEELKFSGPARCFDREQEAFAAVKARKYKEGDVFVIRYEGPKGGPGMREMLATTAALYGQGTGGKMALITDGDIIEIDAKAGTINVKLSAAELDKRRKAWKPHKDNVESGYIWKYAQQVGDAQHGAVTHPGGAAEKSCYA